MARIILLDGNVIDQINRGNARAARKLRALLKAGHTVYMSAQGYKEAVTDRELPRSKAANKLLFQELGIRVAPSGSMAPRVEVYASKVKISLKDSLIAAQAKALNAEVWSFDKVFRNNPEQFRQVGVKVAEASYRIGLVPTSAKQDYRQGRKLLRLPPVNISFKGTVTRPGSSGSPPGMNGAPPGTPPSGGSNKPGKATASRGTAPKPIDTTPSDIIARGQAKGNAAVMGLQILNFIFNKINDNKQKQSADKALKAAMPAIQKILKDEPTKGVLIRFNFSQVNAHPDSAIVPGPVFLNVSRAMGHTRDEAKRNFPAAISENRPNTKYFSRDVWIPPAQKPQPSQLRTPFARQALAQLEPAKARFQNVEWGGVTGFDDEKETGLLLVKDAEFIVLKPPAVITWFHGGVQMQTNIPLVDKSSHNGESLVAVDLDPSLAWDVTAVMLFPSNGEAERLMATTPQTKDNNNLLRVIPNFDKVRWTRPQNLNVSKKY